MERGVFSNQSETFSTPSPRDFLQIVFKRKNQILLFFFVTVCVVAIGSFMTKRTYKASAQILVKIGRENLYVPTLPAGGSANPVISFNREEQINSEIEILKSRFLAEAVVESLGPLTIYKDPENSKSKASDVNPSADSSGVGLIEKAAFRLQQAMTVEGVMKSNVINVSFKHEDPDMAAGVVNTLVNLYLDRHLDVHKSPQSYEFFQQQSQILKERLKHSEEELEVFKKGHAITSLDEERTLLLEQEADLRTALNETLSQEAETESRVRQIRHQLASTPKTVPLDEEINQNASGVNTLQAKLVELELKERELLSKYTDQSRLVRNVREEIQTVRQKLAEQESRRYGKTRSGVNTIYQGLQGTLLSDQAELKALKAKKEIQKAQLVDLQKGLEKLNRVEKELTELDQQVEVDRENYRLYLTKFEESRISNAMDSERIANVSLIEPASPPLKSESRKTRLKLLLAVFLGGIGGLGLAFVWEYLDDRLERNEDVENHLGLPVLASIPEMET